MTIVEMYKKGLEIGLGEWDVFPYDNPQRLNMKQLEERYWDYLRYLDNRDSNFIGGAWSGD